MCRPPAFKAKDLKNSILFDELASNLDELATSRTETLLVGELNVHIDGKTIQIHGNSLECFIYLQQHAKDPNHKKETRWTWS